MRVISGRFKGHRLVSFTAKHIRPTTDRVKETIFNKLMHTVAEAHVLDLFSGTGSLGIEALSRGADHVTFVEMSKKSISILQANLRNLKVPSEEFKVVCSDVFKFIRDYQGEPFDLILIDPPFTEKIAHAVMESLSTALLMSPEATVVIEASRHERLDDSYSHFKLLDKKDFGDKCVAFFTRIDQEAGV